MWTLTCKGTDQDLRHRLCQTTHHRFWIKYQLTKDKDAPLRLNQCWQCWHLIVFKATIKLLSATTRDEQVFEFFNGSQISCTATADCPLTGVQETDRVPNDSKKTEPGQTTSACSPREEDEMWTKCCQSKAPLLTPQHLSPMIPQKSAAPPCSKLNCRKLYII